MSDSSSSNEESAPSGYIKPPANISTGRPISSPPPSQPTTYTPTYSPSTAHSSPSPMASSQTSSTVTSHTTAVGNSSDSTSDRITYDRNYESIPKGGYQGDSYTVKRGDTLYYIAWVTGNDVHTLAVKNNLKEPYAVNVGQVLDVGGGTKSAPVNNSSTAPVTATAATSSTTSTVTPTVAPAVTSSSVVPPTPKPKSVMTTTTTTTTTMSSRTQPPKTTQTTQTVTQPIAEVANSDVDTGSVTSVPARSEPVTTRPEARSNVANVSWQWPAKGKVIEKFSSATKGIDISGSLGDKVMAAADGRVVYSGNALPGYGNLIIIKHNDDYLTAYAHNQSILVKEQQSVKAGEQIATMGATGTSSVRLHFEIRYKAQSVDPQKYLP